MRKKNIICADIDLSDHSDDILEWVAHEFTPDDVFSHDCLEEWAKDHGFSQNQQG